MPAREQRRHRRFSTDRCAIELRRGPFGFNTVLRLIDISEGGVAVLVRRPLAPGERLSARLQSDGDACHVPVTVRRCEKAGTVGAWVAGLQFDEVPAVLRVLLRSLQWRAEMGLLTVTRGDSAPAPA